VNDAKILDMSADNVNKLIPYKERFGEKDILLFIDILSQSVQKLKSSPFQRMDFEIVMLKILHHEPVSSLEEIIKKLSAVEGDLEIDAEQIIREITSGLQAGQVNIKPESIAETDKKKTPETQLTLDKFVSEWENFICHIKTVNSRLGVLEFGVPVSLEENRILKVKFDKKDTVLRNLCDSKKEEIEKELNFFFKTGDVRIVFDEGTVKHTDRIIKVGKSIKKTQDEKRAELLNKAPQLKFLFEEPFNCKFID
ncbi:MAG TPA: hypothetical protein PKW56_04475, partial [Clostridiales bacterium]|nr:hypothetical protein [Clostridiales bacterium]